MAVVSGGCERALLIPLCCRRVCEWWSAVCVCVCVLIAESISTLTVKMRGWQMATASEAATKDDVLQAGKEKRSAATRLLFAA